jgi:hypothetical protein
MFFKVQNGKITKQSMEYPKPISDISLFERSIIWKQISIDGELQISARQAEACAYRPDAQLSRDTLSFPTMQLNPKAKRHRKYLVAKRNNVQNSSIRYKIRQ